MDDDYFFAAIRANPTDGALPLIYADWLEEQSDPRGALLRVWTDLVAILYDDATYRQIYDLVRLYQELRRKVDGDWVRELGAMRLWIDDSLALKLVRLYLRDREGRKHCQQWIDEGATEDWKAGWLVYRRKNDPRSQQKRRHSRHCLFVDNQSGAVMVLGASDNSASLAWGEKIRSIVGK